MKKLMYLLVVGALFAFTACGGGETEACADDCLKECCSTAKCGNDCQKACCLGCKATEGKKKCIVLEDGSMPCCYVVESLKFNDEYEAYLDSLRESGDVDIEYSENHGEESHEGHNHE